MLNLSGRKFVMNVDPVSLSLSGLPLSSSVPSVPFIPSSSSPSTESLFNPPPARLRPPLPPKASDRATVGQLEASTRLQLRQIQQHQQALAAAQYQDAGLAHRLKADLIEQRKAVRCWET